MAARCKATTKDGQPCRAYARTGRDFCIAHDPASRERPLSEAQIEQRGKANLRHGGEGALVRLKQGKPFDGLALAVYQDVLDELGIDLDRLTGIDRVRLERAARFEAVARLFDAAGEAAASIGDLAAWERYQQRAGWIGGKAFAAFSDLRPLAVAGDGLVLDAIQAAKEAGGDGR
jgi:hypothetical protein